MRKTILYTLVLSAAVLAACDETKPVISGDKLEKNDLQITSEGEHFFYRAGGPRVNVLSSVADRNMTVVIGACGYTDTLDYTSLDTNFVATVRTVPASVWSDLCVKAEKVKVEGFALDRDLGDTTRFAFDLRCLPAVTLPAKSVDMDNSVKRTMFKVSPAVAYDGFDVMDNEYMKITSAVTNMTFSVVEYTASRIGDGHFSIVYDKCPDYEYRLPLTIRGHYTVLTGFTETVETIEGKQFTRLKPAALVEAVNNLQKEGFPADLELRLNISAKSVCEWYDDSAWDDPETRTKLLNGYHVIRSDEQSFSTDLAARVTMKGDAIDRRCLYDIDMADVIWNYQNHIEYTGQSFDPVAQLSYPTYVDPVPRRYYTCDTFTLTFTPHPAYDYLVFNEVKEYTWSTQKPLSGYIESKANEEYSSKVTDARGYEALRSWKESLAYKLSAEEE